VNPKSKFRPSWVLVLGILILTFSGCAPKATFPSATITDSIKEISKESYDLDVTARLSGKTVGVLLYLETMLDETGTQIPPEVHQMLGNLTQVITRVALSTDAELDFVVIAMRGQKEMMELRLVRSIDDIKKAHTEALSITESMNRSLFQQSRYDLGLAEADPFPLPDIRLEDFLAQQILQRIRFAKAKDEGEEDAPAPAIPTELYDGRFSRDIGGGTFEVSILNFQPEKSHENLLKTLRTVRDVLGGYQYEEYNWVIIRDLLTAKKITLDRNTVKSFWDKEITEEEIIDGFLTADVGQAQVFKNALEVFGFTQAEQESESKSELVGDER